MSGSASWMGDWSAWLPLSFWASVAALVGLTLGSFAGLVVYRLPRMVLGQADFNLGFPASHCGACGQTLRWWHNLPVLSYVWLRGCCRFCGAPIGRLNLVTELVFGTLWASMVMLKGPGIEAVAWAGFFSVLWVLLLIDWQTLLLPDVLTLPLMAAGVACAYMQWIGLDVVESILAATMGYLMLRLVAWVFERMRGVAGMGGGDPKLMSALGAWLGLQALVWVLLWSSVLHVLWAWVSLRRGRALAHTADDVPTGAVPFGPALVLAAALVWGSSAFAQGLNIYPFKVETQQEDATTQVVAVNGGAAVISVEVHVQGRNLASDRSWPALVSVPPRTKLVLATVYAAQEGEGFEVGIRSSRAFGDLNAPVDVQPYRLPFENGRQFEISQAYGATLTTHQELRLQHAVDFDMPEGTPVLAARSGQVVEVQTGFTEGGANPSLSDRANLVKLLHDDGSVATYAHLAPRGSTVTLGQFVQAGQVLGYSGNTGYSSGPHLHFCVSKPVVTSAGMTEACMPVRFVTGVPPEVFAPQEGLVVQANDSGPAVLKRVQHDRAMKRASDAMATTLSAGDGIGSFASATLGRSPWSAVGWLIDLPLWVWLAMLGLLLLWLFRAFR